MQPPNGVFDPGAQSIRSLLRAPAVYVSRAGRKSGSNEKPPYPVAYLYPLTEFSTFPRNNPDILIEIRM